MDKIAEIKQSVQLSRWSEMVAARQCSGMTVAQWCEREQISRSVYYYRLRKVRECVCEQIPVPVASLSTEPASSAPAVRISCGDMSIEISAQAGTQTIETVIRALKC